MFFCKYVSLSIYIYVRTSYQQNLHFKSNSFDQSFIKLFHYAKDLNFFSFDFGLYHTMSAGGIVLFSWRYPYLNCVQSLNPVILITDFIKLCDNNNTKCLT